MSADDADERAALGARLRARRRASLLTQKELSALTGTARSTIAALENGDGSRTISPRLRGKLERWLDEEEAPRANARCPKCGTGFQVRLVSPAEVRR